MRTNVLIVLALAVLTSATAGCCNTCRNWLRRGSLCGTTTSAPATIGAPVALGTPYIQPQMAAPVQQMVMPQANCQCMPQCMPQCVPVCQPCCDPCATMCPPCDPCSTSTGYLDSGCCGQMAPATGYESSTSVPTTSMPTLPQTYTPQGSSNIGDPGPARVNYPESAKPLE